MRVGMGYDVHRLVEGRKLVIGGVEINYKMGLLGHSDADVLTHAIMDALLGAAGLGDIGKHFPDSSQDYKDISSLKLLAKVAQLLDAHGYNVGNIDCTIVAEQPKMAPHIETMKNNISEVLEIDKGSVNIKATTTEALGFAGRQEGIASYAIALITKK